jgi:hypothetical protein
MHLMGVFLCAHVSKMKDIARLTNEKWHRCYYCHITKWEGRKKESVVVFALLAHIVVAHCQVHTQSISPAPQINLIFAVIIVFFFSFYSSFTSSGMAVVGACLLYEHSSSFCR